jgi:hypothetical protein
VTNEFVSQCQRKRERERHTHTERAWRDIKAARRPGTTASFGQAKSDLITPKHSQTLCAAPPVLALSLCLSLRRFREPSAHPARRNITIPFDFIVLTCNTSPDPLVFRPGMCRSLSLRRRCPFFGLLLLLARSVSLSRTRLLARSPTDAKYRLARNLFQPYHHLLLTIMFYPLVLMSFI